MIKLYLPGCKRVLRVSQVGIRSKQTLSYMYIRLGLDQYLWKGGGRQECVRATSSYEVGLMTAMADPVGSRELKQPKKIERWKNKGQILERTRLLHPHIQKNPLAKAEAVVYERGSGKIKVNGIDYLLYFPVTQDREQLMFPFHFLDRLGKHDTTCTVSGGGRSSEAGAIRLAVARALCSFVTEEEVEWMRQAGLLTADPRVGERKKPGQEGARRKFTWKKRYVFFYGQGEETPCICAWHAADIQ
ncbi:LOW QUALITY PROTEIN: 28S ribosomal protein S9, mitochondrial-like [Mustela erminea]|uniref:LOW QUALITY PROTEIN: 28S ribosomal protein S9, mitochondrial-like n=1 Tax=Mustela erminea TaxID=36723 RepID=UPI0013869F8B|nr:LOW QUALITY PROTEIN: 28S ribosomal protein S9, mitochondrial-like [Mustela erminea]